ncbi:TPA: IS5 family transposase [Pseudomonas aeruginosa]|uniref:IS5 family transposase n=4 Tax=Pseudomonadota TaxID=1224 RepID=A0A844NF24_PSEAI|nr:MULTISPECIES: IS5 family transposase [Pseudomonadota]EJN6721699.1 IS5 family transposase [Pseudomonas aeruginosa]EKT8215551.1 IS5 family transposase [Pseudomonas aeruginosa]EKW0327360.1 IS5 family transposase [Pseudomonas aeruginosa]EKW2706216.1 IS5 family transposase [Pseudomonas aeruginosa]EKW3860857.1 IS5 family transposase [Pseudomonas aeruginosa]
MTLATESDAGFERHRKATRRDVFLAEMDKVVPWDRLCAVVEPHYPKTPERGGRQPIGLERMLRIHLLQQWYALSDPAAEEALYDSQAMRRFVGIDLGREGAPDETTICKFRHLLEKHQLAQPLFDVITTYLGEHGMKLSEGTIVDATIIHAAPSTKNKDHKRDPDMHQTRKGNQWYFGMKAHIGVDERTGLVHTVTTTAANVGDVTEIANLLHGREKAVYGDSGYRGAAKRVKPKRGRHFYIAEQRSKVKAIADAKLREITERIEHLKASIRAAVEHPFRVVKRQFGHTKARYRGLAKNHGQMVTLFALANLWMARKQLLAAG